jgi:hypothetical protein
LARAPAVSVERVGHVPRATRLAAAGPSRVEDSGSLPVRMPASVTAMMWQRQKSSHLVLDAVRRPAIASSSSAAVDVSGADLVDQAHEALRVAKSRVANTLTYSEPRLRVMLLR